MRMTRIIAITSMKGGTGKTTITALLGYGLAELGKKVLLMDLDSQSHLSAYFIPIDKLLEVNDGAFELVTYGVGSINIRKVILSNGKLLYILPSGLNHIMKVVVRGELPVSDPLGLYRQFLRNKYVFDVFDYILIDTAPEAFLPTQWALYTSDYVIIPMNLEELSIIGAQIVLREVLPQFFEIPTHKQYVLGIVLNRITHRFKEETIRAVERAMERFIKTLPSVMMTRTYPKVLFQTRVYSNKYLTRLSYIPRRWEIPLDRVIKRSPTLKSTVISLAKEVEERATSLEVTG